MSSGATPEALAGTAPCACGRCRPIATGRVVRTRALADAVAAELDGRPAAVVGDPATLAACGTALGEGLEARGIDVEVVDLGPAPHADDDTARRVEAGLAPSPRVPVAVGSGTVNDLVKLAASRLGRRYRAVATAPSMNGYTSAVAAITVDGVKRTLPAAPPVAVLADPDVLAASPVRLAVSGLADLLSKPVSTADWRLAHVLWDEPFCATPASLAHDAVARAAAVADAVPSGDSEARLRLFDALVVSGMSMAVAGTSSPASGGEHLVSHFLDMTAAFERGGPRQPALHGEQVGVATATTTRLFRRLLACPTPPDSSRPAPDVDTVRERIEALDDLPRDLRERLIAEGSAKLRRLGSPTARRARIVERWERVRSALANDLDAAVGLARVLPRIGAPVTADAIGVDDAIYERAVRAARWVRDRYTVLDVADDLGIDPYVAS